MAVRAKEIREWLDGLSSGDDLVGIDDGGLALQSVGDCGNYFEIGGIPEEEEEDVDRKTYSVLVTRDITESIQVTVRARNKREAWDLALQKAPNEEGWQVDDGSADDPYLGAGEDNIEEVGG